MAEGIAPTLAEESAPPGKSGGAKRPVKLA
jgi:hypothetical protein